MTTIRLSGSVILCKNRETGAWEHAVPLPFSYGLVPWAFKRLTGWRDAYGRKAHLFLPWE